MTFKERVSLVITLLLSLKGSFALEDNRAMELIEKVSIMYDQDPNVQKLLKKYDKQLGIIFMPDEEYVFGHEGIWGQADRHGAIFLAGGVLRNFLFTDETFLALICHEVGHVLGGWPQDEYHLSFEGQADYYAANVCMRRFYKTFHDELKRGAYLHDHYFKTCEKSYQTKDDIRICAKTMQGGLNLSVASSLAIGEVLLPGPGIDEHFVSEYTNEFRDSSQCIADTYEAGAVCKMDPMRIIDFGAKEDFYCQNRPKCWFNPNDK